MDISTVALIIFGAICYFLYQGYIGAKEEQKKREKDIELARYRKEYEIRQREIVKEAKSDQTRPDDWSMRKDYILKRDGNKCAVCGGTTSLHVHHLNPVSGGADHSENNLIALCVYCHAKQPEKGHGKRLINGEITKKSKKHRYDKRKSLKDYTCGRCGSKISKGDYSYVAKNDLIGDRWENSNFRICEKCLLSHR